MKLVISTQYRENYGSALAPYWKFKGGSTYVVENLTLEQADKILTNGIPTLKALIEYFGPMSEEYIIGEQVVGDSATVCEEWESPTILAWVNSRWTATEVRVNDEFGSMRQDIDRRISSWDMLMGNGRENYTCTYVMRDGRILKESDLLQESSVA